MPEPDANQDTADAVKRVTGTDAPSGGELLTPKLRKLYQRAKLREEGACEECIEQAGKSRRAKPHGKLKSVSTRSLGGEPGEERVETIYRCADCGSEVRHSLGKDDSASEWTVGR